MLVTTVWLARRQQRILKAWPTVDAQVLHSRVGSAISYAANRGNSVAMYAPVIEFGYAVNGKSYVTPASAQVSTSNYTSVKRQVDAYPPGSVHSIRYNPKDPNDIVFDAGYTWSFFFVPLLLGGMSIIFGIVGASLVIASRANIRCPACGAEVHRSQRFCGNCANPIAIGT